MTSTGYHDTGEEWAQKCTYRQDLLVRNTTVSVLLYNDSTNALADADDIAAITTEPTDGNYARQTLSLDATDLSLSVSGGNVQASGTVTFDVTNTTGTVDAYAVVVNYQSDVINSETGANDHLVTSAVIESSGIDLTNWEGLDVQVNVAQD